MASQDPKLPAWVPWALAGASAATAGWSVFQWLELLRVQAGGSAVCAMGETVNCVSVWTLPVASKLHAALGLPVAALGLVWALTAVAASLLYGRAEKKGRNVELWASALRWTAGAGIAAIAFLGAASARGRVVCLTCLGTYLLVAAFALAVWRFVPARAAPPIVRLRGASWALRLALIAYLALLAVGRSDPPTAAQTLANPGVSVEAFLKGLSWAEQQAVSDSLAVYRASPVPDVSGHAVRRREGPADAPVRMVEFTDLLCGHCKTFEQNLAILRDRTPKDAFSVEARFFPLDAECNPQVVGSDGKGLRCLGARAQICLEEAPDFLSLRHKLFEEQRTLTRDRIVEIASSGSVSRASLEACLRSPETERKLQDDIAYAAKFNQPGTPLVVVNGRLATPVMPFLYAAVLLKGDAHAPAWAALPAPTRTGMR